MAAGMSAGRTEQRVVVADDDVLFREGVAGLLERAGFEIAGQAGDAAGLLRVVRDEQPNLAIVDIRMPPSQDTEGLDAARVIRRELPQVGILVLSAHAEVAEAMELLATGRGVGYVLKSRVTRVEDFIETVDRVIDGGSVVDPAVVQELVNVRHREDRLERLTHREREVLELMAEGASNAGIAKRLWVTEGTIEKHVRAILAKLQLAETPDDHRRVLAVLTFLDSR
jgi:DNA-binding NarL/FixJ family response regulator